MFILIKLIDTEKTNIRVSHSKSILEDYIHTNGYYWSEKYKRYIDDETYGEDCGSGIDYIIEERVEIV